MSFAKPRPVHTTVLCRLQTRSASHPAHLSALAAVMPHAKCAVTRALIAAVYGIDRGSVLRSLTPVTVAEHRTACCVSNVKKEIAKITKKKDMCPLLNYDLRTL